MQKNSRNEMDELNKALRELQETSERAVKLFEDALKEWYISCRN